MGRPKKKYKTLQNFAHGYMLGITCGDGHLTKNGIVIVSHFPYLGVAIKKMWHEWTGLHTRHYKYKRTKQAPFQKVPREVIERHTYCNSREVAKYLMGLSFGKRLNTIPKKIIVSRNKRFVAGFLSGFFDSDGGVLQFKPKGTRQTNRRVRCFFASEPIKEQIKTLLTKQGFRVGEYYRGFPRSTWELSITGKDDILKFRDDIGFQISNKRRRLNTIYKNIKQHYNDGKGGRWLLGGIRGTKKVKL